jgi:hypothetical protein
MVTAHLEHAPEVFAHSIGIQRSGPRHGDAKLVVIQELDALIKVVQDVGDGLSKVDHGLRLGGEAGKRRGGRAEIREHRLAKRAAKDKACQCRGDPLHVSAKRPLGLACAGGILAQNEIVVDKLQELDEIAGVEDLGPDVIAKRLHGGEEKRPVVDEIARGGIRAHGSARAEQSGGELVHVHVVAPEDEDAVEGTLNGRHGVEEQALADLSFQRVPVRCERPMGRGVFSLEGRRRLLGRGVCSLEGITRLLEEQGAFAPDPARVDNLLVEGG